VRRDIFISGGVILMKEIPPFWKWLGIKCSECGHHGIHEDPETGQRACAHCGYETNKEEFQGLRGSPANRKFQAVAYYEGWEKRKP
jgi:ribosomal protein L37E